MELVPLTNGARLPGDIAKKEEVTCLAAEVTQHEPKRINLLVNNVRTESMSGSIE
jgi:hypothetical protein